MGESKTTTKDDKSIDPLAQQYISDITSKASGLYNAGAGTGPTVAPMNPTQQTGLSQILGMAGLNQGISTIPFSTALGQIGSSGITSGMQQPLGVLGDVSSGNISTSDVYGKLLRGALTQNQGAAAGSMGVAQGATGPTASESFLTPMASATDVNPYLKGMLEANNARISNRVNSSISGAGRYGSGGHTDVLARSLAESDNPILANAFESGQNRALSAAQAIDAARRGADTTALGGFGQAAGIRQGDTGLGLNAAGGLNTNIQNQITAAGASLGAQQGASNNALGWAGLAPTLNNLQYDPANRIAGVGELMQGRDQAEMTAQQNMPWQQLARYLGSVAPFNPVFAQATDGTKTETKPFNFMDYMKLFQGGNNSAASGAAGFIGAL